MRFFLHYSFFSFFYFTVLISCNSEETLKKELIPEIKTEIEDFYFIQNYNAKIIDIKVSKIEIITRSLADSILVSIANGEIVENWKRDSINDYSDSARLLQSFTQKKFKEVNQKKDVAYKVKFIFKMTVKSNNDNHIENILDSGEKYFDSNRKILNTEDYKFRNLN